ncbi:uncharacterized protein N7483_008015 [Penicillium malachiteum]|uniref:uncharacterized protein n=1 Tax=Penicillium malachiteum TaxID=1324776 RepID=UPI002547961E|nr:uncharacterized protein N7483_008015 [Penicillium malachiteum]KAJ5726658.1 hypothetical protein N7483_008015 [Penicillium malachiteum]
MLPRILGLTASPVNSKVSSLETLETNLDSICMVPSINHDELVNFTNHPEVHICRLSDGDSLNTTAEPRILSRLRDMIEHADQSLPMGSQLHRFVQISETVFRELGSWASAEYIAISIKYFKENQRFHAETDWYPSAAKNFTMQILCDIGRIEQPQLPIMPDHLSPKCWRLLETLSRLASCDFRGLVFVNLRASAMIIKSLIERHTDTKDHYRCGTFIGMSNIQGRGDLNQCYHDIDGQGETLSKFKMGELNLIITTSALEEGIDIPACNTVISFDRPKNITSFIQRRGRARQEKSNFIVFTDGERDERDLIQLMKCGDDMKKIYQDHTRFISNTSRQAEPYMTLEVKSTGSRLGMLDAVSHLNMFCAKVLKQPYTTNRPIFRYRESSDGQIQGTALLPSALHASLQEIDGLRWWSTTKLAQADAALQAYTALRTAGLVNEYLLPTKAADIINLALLSREGFHLLPEPIHPWAEAAARWNIGKVSFYAHRLRIQHPRKNSLELMMIIPLQIQFHIRFPLFISHDTTLKAHLSPGSLVSVDSQTIASYRQVTHLIFQSIHGQILQPKEKMDYVTLFIPYTQISSTQRFLEKFSNLLCIDGIAHHIKAPRLLASSTASLQSSSDLPYAAQALQVHAVHMSRRRNFLLRWPPTGSTLAQQVPIGEIENMFSSGQEFSAHRLEFECVQAATFLPSIMHEIGNYMMAEQLRKKLLSGIEFRRMSLLSLAIQPTCSKKPARFRSLAFVGATFLKYIISEQLFLHHPAWHEGLLSKVKEAVISNYGLAHAAKLCGLGEFMTVRRFNGRKWQPAWISSLLPPPVLSRPRKVSSRTLAEMVRAIIGAAYIDGDIEKATRCAGAIVPTIKTWHAAALSDGSYEQTRPNPTISYPVALAETEKLLGYTFADRSLLVEALTHPSHYGTGLFRSSAYGRLAFLGEAVLELVVTQSLLHAPSRTLEVHRLHSLRTAVTNHLFLSFLSLEFHLEIDPQIGVLNQPTLSRTVEPLDEVYLWTYLQSHSQELTTSLNNFRSSSRPHCWRIQRTFLKNGRYPWAELSAMSGQTLLSDIVKSAVGAVFVDSRASLRECQQLANRMGIIHRANQLLRNDVITDHPKIQLQKLYPRTKIVYRCYTIPQSENNFCCAIWLDDKKAIDLQQYPCRESAIISAAQALVLRGESPEAQ